MENPLLFSSLTIISLAMIFYTVGVWSEWYVKQLRPWHVVCFSSGVVTDTIGTGIMMYMGQMTNFHDTFHLVTGWLALILMIIHAAWAIRTIRRGCEHELQVFNRFSIFVWCVWMIPYCTGGMIR